MCRSAAFSSSATSSLREDMSLERIREWMRANPQNAEEVRRQNLHVYGTPFFIQARLPLTGEKRTDNFDRLMIAQDTGSAIVGPARADIYWGAGVMRPSSRVASISPATSRCWCPEKLESLLVAGERMPLPPEKPPPARKT